MVFNNRKFKFSRIAQDGFPIFLTLIAIFCAYFAAELLVQPSKDLNSGSILLYITIATLTSSLISPILSMFGVEKNTSKLTSIYIGVILSFILFSFTMFHSRVLFEYLIVYSRRGGFTAISISLLLFQLASINYEIQINREKNHLEEMVVNKNELINQKKELIEAKERILEQQTIIDRQKDDSKSVQSNHDNNKKWDFDLEE